MSNEYIGPYPPEGIHDYVIYVFALKAPAASCPGNFDAESVSVSKRSERDLIWQRTAVTAIFSPKERSAVLTQPSEHLSANREIRTTVHKNSRKHLPGGGCFLFDKIQESRVFVIR